MAHRLRLILIMAFVIAQFGMVNGTSAYASPMDMMENCRALADECCDPVGLDHCTSCATCVGYISGPGRSLERTNAQFYGVIAPVILSPIVWSIDPPPPRY
ncbi:hypothetical protein [Sphingorhabdus sp.]|uniref:hypothetical protein n=1 Tax=Sphingorhabdus sp. TaxID=1902408 RepID=UPI00359373C0